MKVRSGPIVCVSRLALGERRGELHAAGAIAVDMESVWLAPAAGGRPFAVVRVVLDSPSHAWRRPRAVIGAMRGSGRVPVRVVVDGVRLRSHTQIRRVTPVLLVCESVVPGVGVELHSAYVSRGGRGRVEHLALGPAHFDVESAVQDRHWLLVPAQRRPC